MNSNQRAGKSGQNPEGLSTAEDRVEKTPIGVSYDKFLIFYLAGEPYALSITQVAEVINPLNVTLLPEMPEWMLGIANLRGEIVSVADLAVFCAGRSDEPRGMRSKFIVVPSGVDESLVAFSVDRLGEITSAVKPEAGCDPACPFVTGTAGYRSQTLKFLDMRKLLPMLRIEN